MESSSSSALSEQHCVSTAGVQPRPDTTKSTVTVPRVPNLCPIFSETTGAGIIKVVKLSKSAVLPTKSTPLSAGYDLYAAKKYMVPAHGKQLIDTDLQIEMPAGTYGRIAPTSKLSWKHHVSVSAGVVDADYRGNVRVVLFNHGNKPLVLDSGEKVAQLICEKLAWPIDIVECQNLSETIRADRGVKRNRDDTDE